MFFLVVLSPSIVFANIYCSDGTISKTCSDCHGGCCSNHGGCATKNDNNNQKNSSEVVNNSNKELEKNNAQLAESSSQEDHTGENILLVTATGFVVLGLSKRKNS